MRFATRKRHMRRRRRRGGALVEMTSVQNVFECIPPASQRGDARKHAYCLKEFMNEFEYTKIPSSDDGNCFFNSLLEFARRYMPAWFEQLRIGVENNGSVKQNTMMDAIQMMRNQVADYMEQNLHRWIDSIFLENNETEEEVIEGIIETVRTVGAWNNQAGDLMVQYASERFGIDLMIHDFQENEDTKQYAVTNYIYRSAEHPISATILRTMDGHYDLLVDTEDNEDLPPLRTLFAARSKKKAVATTTKKPTRASTRKKKPVLSNSVLRSNSNNGELARELARLSLNKNRAATAATAATAAHSNVSRQIQEIQNDPNLSINEKEAMIMSLLE